MWHVLLCFSYMKSIYIYRESLRLLSFWDIKNVSNQSKIYIKKEINNHDTVVIANKIVYVKCLELLFVLW